MFYLASSAECYRHLLISKETNLLQKIPMKNISKEDLKHFKRPKLKFLKKRK
jgi:hypothetical protein